MDHPILFTIVSAFFLFAFYLTITGQQNRPLLIVSKEEIVIWPSFEPIIELNISDYFLIDRSDYLFKNRMSMTIKKYDIKNNQDTTFHLTIIDLYDKVYEYDSKSFHKLDNTVLFAIESFANLKNACLIRKGEWLSIEDRMEMPSFEVKPVS